MNETNGPARGLNSKSSISINTLNSIWLESVSLRSYQNKVNVINEIRLMLLFKFVSVILLLSRIWLMVSNKSSSTLRS